MLALGQPAQGVLDDDHGPVDDQAEIERAQAHQVAGDVQPVHADGAEQHGQGDDQGGDQGRAPLAQDDEQHRHHQQGAFA